MALCILDVIVRICAIVGFVLGVFNFWKDRKKEKREAKIRADQHLVKAEYRRNQTQTKRLASDLYVVNADTRPVTAVYVDFFNDASQEKPAFSKDCGSLGPSGDVFVRQFGPGERFWKFAKFTYTDADGHKHEYEQNTIV